MNWKLWAEIAVVSLVTTAIIFHVDAIRRPITGA